MESTSAPIIKVVTQRGGGDCGICCLAMFLGVTYEDALAAAVTQTKDRKLHRRGMWDSQIIRTAKVLGVALHKQRRWDMETADGILCLFTAKHEDHVVVLHNGMIFDTDGTVWEPELYLKASTYHPTHLLVKRK